MLNFYDQLAQLAYKLAYRVIVCIWFFTRPTVSGVYVAVWHHDRILIIKNSYKKKFTLPCGRLKKREEKRAAAVRELHEEVNIQVDGSQLSYAGSYIGRYKYVTDIGDFFEIRMSERPTVRVDNREVIWARFMSIKESLQLPLNPAVRSYLSRPASLS